LLLFSCSLFNPPLADETLQSPPERDEAASFVQPVLTNESVYCVVKTGYEEGLVNLRAGSGTNFDVLIVLPENTRLEVLQRGNWLKTRTAEGIAGYINSRYCKIGEQNEKSHSMDR